MIVATTQPIKDWQQRFLDLVPAIRRRARIAFVRYTPERLEDAVAEVVASCYVAYARLVELGKEDLAYPSVLAGYAVRQFRAGRRVGTRANKNDVYARNHKRGLCHIGAPAEQAGGWKEMLFDDGRTPVPEQAAFRIDFPDWLTTLPSRDRRIAQKLAAGDRNKDVSASFGISPARVSQLRHELHCEWEMFHSQQCLDADEDAINRSLASVGEAI